MVVPWHCNVANRNSCYHAPSGHVSSIRQITASFVSATASTLDWFPNHYLNLKTTCTCLLVEAPLPHPTSCFLPGVVYDDRYIVMFIVPLFLSANLRVCSFPPHYLNATFFYNDTSSSSASSFFSILDRHQLSPLPRGFPRSSLCSLRLVGFIGPSSGFIIHFSQRRFIFFDFSTDVLYGLSPTFWHTRWGD